MSFPTVTFSGAASGGGGPTTTTGTFTASITGVDNGAVTGTWAYDGTYLAYSVPGTEHLSGTLTGTGSAAGPWAITLNGTDLFGNAAGTLTFGAGQYSFDVNGGFLAQYTLSFDYGGSYTYEVPVQFHGSLASAGAVPGTGAATEGADTLTGTAGADMIAGLGGNDKITGGGGNDSIDGGAGIDTAVFGDVRANYTVTHVSGTTWTVAHTGADGTDTLTGVERLLFSDAKLAIDIDGDGGKAYRLYQAAFDRVPDVPGLGYQMNDLDQGYTLAQVAANFIASPEFQSKYGTALDDSAFVTLLYQHVLHRNPEAQGLQDHLNELAHGYSRADVLTFFSESPENQASVLGTIGGGMVYILP